MADYSGRKVLVLITDGDNTVKGTSFDQALEAAQRAEVMVYSLIDVPIVASAGRNTGGEHALITLSEQTGGRYYYVNEQGIERSYERIQEDLRTQYMLAYYPQHRKTTAGFRRIAVSMRAPDKQEFQLRYRAGYFAGGGENAASDADDGTIPLVIPRKKH
jgi:Ca-activated chloride channel family protein